jgi:hypothetical protein
MSIVSLTAFLIVLLAALPGVAQIYWIEAPEFAPPWTGYIPELGDLDGDEDYDLIYAIVLQSYRNGGTPSFPSWQPDDSLVAGVTYENCMTTCLADLDADGDLDLSVGRMYGEIYSTLYYENVGTANEPAWEEQHSMYLGVCVDQAMTHPELADLDDDGDLDLVVSCYVDIFAYRNTGTPETPIWTEDASLIDGLTPAYGEADPNFCDLDADGDLDVVLGSRAGGSPMMCFENAGTPVAPTWVEHEAMLTGIDREIGGLGLDLADLDGDGDADLLVKPAGAEPIVYLNCGPITLVEEFSTWGRIKGLFRER